ncbi:MAG: protein-disulfide reductase DsbD [Gammaproteobacteria bacterium]|nr:protein-disulfide reductase DsbD [Gammaproteobacteria bacterium]
MKRLVYTMLGALLALSLMPSVRASSLPDGLLKPDAAFALSVRVQNANSVVAHWNIAKGYYLHRDKFRFVARSGGIGLGHPVFPTAITEHVQHVGNVEIYRNAVSVSLPLSRTDPAVRTLILRVTAQGCSDIGICYPPIVKTVALTLPAVSAATTPSALDGTDTQFLKPGQAFRLKVVQHDAHSLSARLIIAPGYYLYRDKVHFRLMPGQGVRLAPYVLPRGFVKVDPFIGRTEIYRTPVRVILPLAGNASQVASLRLRASYQGCAEKGICYPPVTKIVTVAMTGAGGPNATTLAGDLTGGAPARHASLRTYVIAMLAAFGTGILLAFTPCVLPMIPILSSIIVGQSDRNVTKLRAGLLSLSYVLGTAATYTAAGALAGATGIQLQAYFQNPYAIGLFSAIFVLLALSMFGFYELQMPAFIQSQLHRHSQELHKKSGRFRGGAFLGTFALGLLSALIVGACVSPLLISALGIAISSHDPALGAAIMFSIAMGTGAVLIVIGVGAGALMPKAGPWMDRVKHVFGVLLLGIAIYVLSALPQVPVLLLWAALLIVTGVYLGATQSLPKDAGGWRFLWKGIGTVMLIWGIVALLGGLSGRRDILNPLPPEGIAGITARITAGKQPGPAPLFQRYSQPNKILAALAEARAQNKPVVLDFYATWCVDCVQLERGTFSNSRVRAALHPFVTLQADVTNTDAATLALKQRFGVLGPPAVLWFAPDGKEMKRLRFYGYRSPNRFLDTVRRAEAEISGKGPGPSQTGAT